MTTPPDETDDQTRVATDEASLRHGDNTENDLVDAGEGLGSAEGGNDPDTETDEDPRFA